MSATATVPEPPSVTHPTQDKKRAVALVFLCTVFGAAAQVLIKFGAAALPNPTLAAMLQSLPLLAGYSLYGISTVLLVVALRKGELSILYPVISLTYVWVTVLSVLIFREDMNAYKILGVAVVVLGVAVLGRGGKK